MENNAKDQAREQLASIIELMAAYVAAATGGTVKYDGETLDQEQIQDRILETPLSVEVRSGWYTPGNTPEPEEYQILLCTGGPAVRIVGALDSYGTPADARLEYQDWGTEWTEYPITAGNEYHELMQFVGMQPWVV